MARFKIKRFNTCSKGSVHYGKWFVVLPGEPERYLHSDGVLRGMTRHNGEWTGFFETADDASAVVNQFRQKRRKAKR